MQQWLCIFDAKTIADNCMSYVLYLFKNCLGRFVVDTLYYAQEWLKNYMRYFLLIQGCILWPSSFFLHFLLIVTPIYSRLAVESHLSTMQSCTFVDGKNSWDVYPESPARHQEVAEEFIRSSRNGRETVSRNDPLDTKRFASVSTSSGIGRCPYYCNGSPGRSSEKCGLRKDYPTLSQRRTGSQILARLTFRR